VRQSFKGRIRGAQLQSLDDDFVMAAEGETLRPIVARNAFSAFRGVTFARRNGDTCESR
jgi:hypothetical protein